jgi:hypothetical protein
LPVSYPIQFNLYENDEIVNSGSIEKINNFIQLSSLSKSASYTLEVTDND